MGEGDERRTVKTSKCILAPFKSLLLKLKAKRKPEAQQNEEQQSFRFLNLPLELRVLVYKEVLFAHERGRLGRPYNYSEGEHESDIDHGLYPRSCFKPFYNQRDSDRVMIQRPHYFPAIALVSKKIRAEALDVYCGQCLFLDFAQRYATPGMQPLDDDRDPTFASVEQATWPITGRAHWMRELATDFFYRFRAYEFFWVQRLHLCLPAQVFDHTEDTAPPYTPGRSMEANGISTFVLEVVNGRRGIRVRMAYILLRRQMTWLKQQVEEVVNNAYKDHYYSGNGRVQPRIDGRDLATLSQMLIELQTVVGTPFWLFFRADVENPWPGSIPRYRMPDEVNHSLCHEVPGPTRIFLPQRSPDLRPGWSKARSR